MTQRPVEILEGAVRAGLAAATQRDPVLRFFDVELLYLVVETEIAPQLADGMFDQLPSPIGGLPNRRRVYWDVADGVAIVVACRLTDTGVIEVDMATVERWMSLPDDG